MATARTIITDAFKKLKIYQKGEALDSDEAADGLRSLNYLLDSWANEKLMTYQLVERTKALTADDGTYTIGSGGDIDTTRPVRIDNAFIRDAQSGDYVVEIVNNEQYSKIVLKSTSGTYPKWLYYRAAYPLGTIELYPLPGSNLTLHMNVWDQLTQFTSLYTSASLPPGYERALIYNLALEIAPEYKDPSPLVMKLAAESKERIKDVNNSEIPIITSDIVGVGGGARDLFPFGI